MSFFLVGEFFLFFFSPFFRLCFLFLSLSPPSQKKKEEILFKNSHVLQAVDPPVVRGGLAPERGPHLLPPDPRDVPDLHLPAEERCFDLDSEDDVERVRELVFSFFGFFLEEERSIPLVRKGRGERERKMEMKRAEGGDFELLFCSCSSSSKFPSPSPFLLRHLSSLEKRRTPDRERENSEGGRRRKNREEGGRRRRRKKQGRRWKKEKKKETGKVDEDAVKKKKEKTHRPRPSRTRGP